MKNGIGELRGQSERALGLLASWVAGRSVGVVVSDRLRSRAVLAMEQRLLFLDPARCGLQDLVLLAPLVRHRRVVKERFRRSAVPAETVERWVERSRATLARRSPGLGRFLDDRLGAEATSAGEAEPRATVTWREVALERLSQLSGLPDGFVGLTDVDLDGIEQDLDGIAERLAAAEGDLRFTPELREMPSFEIPGHLHVHDASTRWDAVLETIRSVERPARDIERCYRAKASGVAPARTRRRRPFGSRLDAQRLHAAHVAARHGRPAAVFAPSPREDDGVFRPEQHMVLIGVDLRCLRRDESRRATFRMNLLFMLVRAYERLGIDQIVMTFCDRIISLPDGRDVYLHMPILLKDVDEPIDRRVWMRLDRAWQRHTALPARSSSFQPIQVRTLLDRLRESPRAGSYRFFGLDYFSLDHLHPSESRGEYFSRVAHAVDAELATARRDLPGEWSYATYLPKAVTDRAPKGSIVRDLGFPGDV